METHNILNGNIVHGDHIGKTLGFPTANLQTADPLPPDGVYIARMSWKDGTRYGMLDIGLRPTVGGKEQRVEIHLLDFHGDLYGKKVRIETLHFLRKEQKFADTDALRRQLDADLEATRNYLGQNHLKNEE